MALQVNHYDPRWRPRRARPTGQGLGQGREEEIVDLGMVRAVHVVQEGVRLLHTQGDGHALRRALQVLALRVIPGQRERCQGLLGHGPDRRPLAPECQFLLQRFRRRVLDQLVSPLAEGRCLGRQRHRLVSNQLLIGGR